MSRGLYKRIWLVELVHRQNKKKNFLGNAKKVVENSDRKSSLEILNHLTHIETLSVVGVEEGNADSCKFVCGGSLWGMLDVVSLTFER